MARPKQMPQPAHNPLSTHNANIFGYPKRYTVQFSTPVGLSAEKTRCPNLSFKSNIFEERIFFIHVAANPTVI